jgi:hypothetical protein
MSRVLWQPGRPTGGRSPIASRRERRMRRRSAALGVMLLVVSPALPVSPSGASTTAPQTANYRPPSRYIMAAYDWTSMYGFDAAEVAQRLRHLRDEGYRAVYLDVSPALDLYDLDQPYRDVAIGRFMQRTRTYIRLARSIGIAVQALSGAPTWATPSRRHLNSLLIRFVGTYNRKVPAVHEFRGIQLDVEFYSRRGFFSAQREAVSQYLAMLRLVQRDLRARRMLDLQLGVAVPFWLDEEGKRVRSISFGKSRKRPIYHVMDVLSRHPRAYLVVMAYRNYPQGSDGTIRHVRDELAYATKRSLGVVVGQEFSNVEPSKITFYSKGKRSFRSALYDIVARYRHTRSFRGVSVNDVQSYVLASS